MSYDSKEHEKVINAVCAFLCSLILIHALYSIYIGYHPPISEFCTTNVTFTKINQVIVENPAIVDLHNMLGESGKVIQLYRVEAITELIFITVINVCLGLCFSLVSLVFIFALLIFHHVYRLVFPECDTLAVHRFINGQQFRILYDGNQGCLEHCHLVHIGIGFGDWLLHPAVCKIV
jgi:hypothetical protein